MASKTKQIVRQSAARKRDRRVAGKGTVQSVERRPAGVAKGQSAPARRQREIVEGPIAAAVRKLRAEQSGIEVKEAVRTGTGRTGGREAVRSEGRRVSDARPATTVAGEVRRERRGGMGAERIHLENSAAERLAGKIDDVVVVRGDAPLVERRSFASRVQRWQDAQRWRLGQGWFERARAWWWGRTSGGRVDTRQLDEVKASVMSELKNIRATRRELATSQPFDGPFANVMLPPKKRPSLALPRGWVVFGGLVVVLGAVLWWLSNLQPVTAEQVVSDALAAVRAGDVKTFEERVDVDSLAVSIVDQVLTNPQVDLAVLPGDLQAELQQGLKARMEALIKPGLAARMSDQVRELVAAKRVPAGESDGVLGQVWDDLGGSGLAIRDMDTKTIDAGNALVDVRLSADGQLLSPPLEVSLARQAGLWQVVGLPNLAAVIRARDAARLGIVAPAPMVVAEPVSGGPLVDVKNVVKAKGPEGVLLISADLANVSAVKVNRTDLTIRFADAAGVPLFVTDLSLAEPLAPGETRTQTWSVPLEVNDAKAKYVYALPQAAMRTVVEVR